MGPVLLVLSLQQFLLLLLGLSLAGLNLLGEVALEESAGLGVFVGSV